MKKILYTLFLSQLLWACNESPKTETSTSENPPSTQNASPPKQMVFASYVGAFEAEEIKEGSDATYSNLINITIHQLENGQATGRSIIAGNDRPFTGTYKQAGNVFDIIASEPGDDKHDGRFEFKLDTSKQTVEGKWYCNDKNIAVPVRKFALTKKTFSYNPENNFDESIVGASLYNGKDMEESSYEAITAKVTKINASTQKLNNKDVENLYKGDLEVIRNAIYARHGYSFRNRRMRYLFDNLVEWYIPSNVDVRNELTALEKDNIALIKRYEDHAEKYYDEFSR